MTATERTGAEAGRKEKRAEISVRPSQSRSGGGGGGGTNSPSRVNNYVSVLFALMSTCTVFLLASQQAVRRTTSRQGERRPTRVEGGAMSLSNGPPVDEYVEPMRRVFYEHTPGEESPELSDKEMAELLRIWHKEWRDTGWDMKERPGEERARSDFDAEQDEDFLGVMVAKAGLRFWMYRAIEESENTWPK